VVVEPFEKRDRVLLDVTSLESLLQPRGRVSLHLDGYEDRPQQVEMIDYVSQAFNQDKITVVEAGTGTGKTMAYLLPAIYWSTSNRQRVVISTNTINLQEQLIKKDIPFLKKVLDIEFEAVLVKGRNNYICLRKVEDTESDSDSSVDVEDKQELLTLLRWARRSREGSKSDLSFIPSPDIWERIESESDTCTRSRCKYYRECFVNKARRRATRADILVVNHHLLFADLSIRYQMGGVDELAVLPPYQRIIFDEAHHIEDVATNYFGSQITRTGLLRIFSRLHRRQKALMKGQLHALHYKLLSKNRVLPPDLWKKIENTIRSQLVPGIDSIVAETDKLMDQVFDVIEDHAGKKIEHELKIRLLPHVVDIVFKASGLDDRISNYLSSLQDLSLALKNLIQQVQKAEKYAEEDWASLTIETDAMAERISTAAEILREVIFDDDETTIRWLEIRPGRARRPIVRFCCSPLAIDGMMNRTVYDVFGTVVMTSATLSVENRFDFLADRIGLNRVSRDRRTELMLAAPFDYKKQVTIGIPLDIPDPKHPNFSAEVTKAILKALIISGGHAFVLFTSYGLLNQIFRKLNESLEMIGIKAIKQGSMNRHDLLNHFKKDKSSVLFATDSFWEGVDVPGEALQLVIITKLPFKVPNEPIIEARYEAIEKAGGNAFMDYAVPMAVLKFKQGFGRLVRNRTDKGSVLILDNRVVQKNYGIRFLRSLPECDQIVGSREEVFDKLKNFFT
jgi:ATP-dependent DNA helicase DinG